MSHLTFSSWNVRSGSSKEQQEKIVLALGRKDIDFCAVSEMRLKGQGELVFDTKDMSNDITYHYTLIYSGSEKGGNHGVGLFFKTIRRKDLLGYTVGSKFPERLLVVSFTGCHIISFYGFTESKPRNKEVSQHIEDKELLYIELDTMYSSLDKRKFPVFVMGDFNARIGFRGNPRMQVGAFGDYCERSQNENGQHLMDFSIRHYMCHTKTFFRKPTRKWTWKSNKKKKKPRFGGRNSVRQRFKACLDHILVKNQWRTSVKDVSLAALDPLITDHRRIDLKFQLKWCKSKKHTKSDKMRIDFFKDTELTEQFVQRMEEEERKNIQQTGEASSVSTEERWKWTKETIFEISESIQEKKSPKFNSISSEATQTIWSNPKMSAEERKREGSKRFQEDSENRWNMYAEDVMKAWESNDTTEFYQLLKKADVGGPKWRKKEADAQEFAGMIEAKCGTSSKCTPVSTVENNIPLEEPNLSEIQEIIKTMKNRRACGDDGIPMEVWKIPKMQESLFDLIYKCWKERKIPEDWRITIVVPVPKPKKNAHRPVSLLSTAYKVYLKWILKRMQENITSNAGPTQSGFIPKRSTMDKINLVHRLRERAIEFKTDTWFIFSDVKSAFDTISREAVYNVLTNGGVSAHLMELLKDCLTNITAYVKTSSMRSNKFRIDGGVPQGSSLSPGLFASTLGFAIADAFQNMETIHGEFADDLFNVVTDRDKIIPVIVNNMKSLGKIGSKLEPSKTELLHVNDKGEEKVYGIADTNLSFSSDSTFDEMFKLQTRTSLRYLGDQLGRPRAAIKVRISKASQAYGRFFHKLWSRSEISSKVKIKVFKACVLSVLSYGLKCHAATETMMRSLNYFCLRKLKSILGLPFDAKISYEKMDEILVEHKIEWEWPVTTLQKQRLYFFTEKLKDEEITEILTPKKGETRRRGRPRFRMIDAIKDDLWKVEEIDFDRYDEYYKNNFLKSERAKKVIYACMIISQDKKYSVEPGRCGKSSRNVMHTKDVSGGNIRRPSKHR